MKRGVDKVKETQQGMVMYPKTSDCRKLLPFQFIKKGYSTVELAHIILCHEVTLEQLRDSDQHFLVLDDFKENIQRSNTFEWWLWQLSCKSVIIIQQKACRKIKETH